MQYQNWRLEEDQDHITWLYFDKKKSAVNTIDREVMQELSTIIDSIAQSISCKAVVLLSAKKTGFIAGADISQFNQFKDVDEAVALLRQGQIILDKLEALKVPTIALIKGFCLGGGLEIALACRYRIAQDDPQTRLGLPEVKLGIHPGWGGSVRLPKLIGAMQGLNLVLSGHTVSGKQAAKLGFVDAAVPERQLLHAARYYALTPPPAHQASFLQKFTNRSGIRSCLAPIIRKNLRAKANPAHYPAPFDALTNWEQVGVNNHPAAMEREAKTCGKLFFSETSQNLVRVFFLQERLKGLAKNGDFTPKRVHVVGAGTMGGDIAAWCALRDFHVTLQDLEPRLVAPAIKRAHALFKEKLKEPYLIRKAMDNLTPDVRGDGIARADVIIEAVVEDLAIKQELFKTLEARAKPEAILATNTSSILLDEINTVLQAPERLVGIHFFNPVAKMLLVEVVRGKKTSTDTAEKAVSFVRKLDRLPLPVKSSPGFLVNRILMPYLMESMVMLEEGIPPAIIDHAMTAFGMPMGPVMLADIVGLDVCLSVAKYLSQHYHRPLPKRLINMVAQKKLGKKTGEGFYQYDKKGKPIKKWVSDIQPLEKLSDRLVTCMIKEAKACLQEGVVADADLLDAGMVFGTGFAPFRGGLMHYASSSKAK